MANLASAIMVHRKTSIDVHHQQQQSFCKRAVPASLHNVIKLSLYQLHNFMMPADGID